MQCWDYAVIKINKKMIKKRLCKGWFVNVTEHSPTIKNKFDVEYINSKTRQVFTHSYLTIKEINKLDRKAKAILCSQRRR